MTSRRLLSLESLECGCAWGRVSEEGVVGHWFRARATAHHCSSCAGHERAVRAHLPQRAQAV